MYKRILVPIDGSPVSDAGLREACKFAEEQGAVLRVLHVVDEILAVSPELYGGAYDRIVEGLRQAGAAILASAESLARKEGHTVETQLVEAMGLSAGECAIRVAQAWSADLIVCGTHGRRGLRRIVMGSDAEYIVRHTPVPVLLIRQNG